MKVQVLSDLHLDFLVDNGREFISRLNPEDVDVLVLAGDLAEVVGQEYPTMLDGLCSKYPHVVMVSGNHELYHSSPEVVRKVRVESNARLANLHWLENETWEHKGQRFIGCTLWFRNNPMASLRERHLNDFVVIYDFKPWVYEANADSVKYLTSEVRSNDIVVTHHLPSDQSVHQFYRNDPLNPFFVCDMSKLINGRQPKLWVHGHTHSWCDYTIGTTRVVCNPLGYPGSRNKYVEKMVIDTSSFPQDVTGLLSEVFP